MKKTTIHEFIINEISKVLKEEVNLDSNMENTPVWDSLKKIDVIFAVEDKFDVKFNKEVLVTLNSVLAISDEVNKILK